MAVLTNQAQTLLTGLSDFWQRFFADKGILNALYAATEVEVGQAYLDIVTQVLNQNLDDAPLFNRQYWKNVTIRQDEVRYDSAYAYPYRYELEDDIAALSFLLNRIYDPTLALEDGIDFEIDDGVLGFADDPFDYTKQLASRQADITPTVYREGEDGFVAEAAADPQYPDAPVDTEGKTFFIHGIVRSGSKATFPELNVATLPGGNLSPKDIGRVLVHIDPANPSATPLEREIIGVVDHETAVLGTDLGATYTAQTYNWDLRDTEYFTEYDVGTSIVITDPTSLGRTLTYPITEVVDGLTVKVGTEIDLTPSYQVRLAWTHQSAERVTEISFWAPDAMLDRENLYLSFGYLLHRYEPSSESYRALIQGIFRYFMLGPALQRTESALNVMSGIPVVRTDGETIEELDTAHADYDVVVTDQDRYRIPKDSFKTALAIDDTVDAFEPLTDVFEVTDYVKDPNWYIGRTIPEALLPGPVTPRRAVDPNLYPARVGSDKWLVGDPGLYVGADDHGHVIETQTAGDIFPDGADETTLVFTEEKLHTSDVGKTIEIEDVEYEITTVGASPDPYIQVTDGTTTPFDLTNVFTSRQYLATVTEFGSNLMNIEGHPFDPKRDVGRLVDVVWATNIALTKFRIIEIVSPNTVRLEHLDGTKAVLFTDAGFLVQLGLHWRLEKRAPLRHTTGYLLMRDMLKTHLWRVSYSYTDYPDTPYPRPEQDIRNVLSAGKPGYTYLLVDAGASFDDEVGVGEDTVQIQGVLALDKSLFQEEDAVLKVGSPGHVGDWYNYMGPDPAWAGVLREDVLDGSVVEIPDVSTVDEVTFRSALTGGTTPTLDVTLYEWDGAAWQATGVAFTLDPAATNTHTETVAGRRLAVDVVVNGTPDQAGLEFLFDTATPQTLIQTAPDVTSTSGSVSGGAQFNDTTIFFNAADILREFVAHVDGTYRRYRISSIVSDHTVSVIDVSTGAAPTFPTQSNIEWYWSVPTAVATSAVVGGANPDVVKPAAGNYIIAWPILVTLQN